MASIGRFFKSLFLFVIVFIALFAIRFRFFFGCIGISIIVITFFLFQFLEKLFQRFVAHCFQAGKREGWLVADGKENNRIAGWRSLEFEIKQSLV